MTSYDISSNPSCIKTGYVFGGEKGLVISPIIRAFDRTIKLAGHKGRVLV